MVLELPRDLRCCSSFSPCTLTLIVTTSSSSFYLFNLSIQLVLDSFRSHAYNAGASPSAFRGCLPINYFWYLQCVGGCQWVLGGPVAKRCGIYRLMTVTVAVLYFAQVNASVASCSAGPELRTSIAPAMVRCARFTRFCLHKRTLYWCGVLASKDWDSAMVRCAIATRVYLQACCRGTVQPAFALCASSAGHCETILVGRDAS
jgi:hypothetical protein